MLSLKRNTIEIFVEELKRVYQRTYTDLEPEYGNIIVWTGRLALENIANSNALYHDLEHTVMVTLAGQAILEGKHFSEGGVFPRDWLHFMIALLCHDIGYVRGVCSQDQGNKCATGIGEETVELPAGCTDVSLTPYHVDRSKLFIRERFGSELLMGMEEVIDVNTIASFIETTRFPVPDKKEYKDTKNFPGLIRAADLIGQLGDPNYLRKTPALFYEFEEIGMNESYQYKHPGDLRETYAKFYWGVISPYIQDALYYLNVTQEGKQWIANLHSHVFVTEHGGLG